VGVCVCGNGGFLRALIRFVSIPVYVLVCERKRERKRERIRETVCVWEQEGERAHRRGSFDINNRSMYQCTCTFVYIRILYMYINAYMNICTHVHFRRFMCIYVRMFMYIYTYVQNICCIHVYIYVHKNTHTFMSI